MKSFFKTFCLVLFLYGCKSTKTEQLSGFYEQKKVGKPFRQIQLYKDRTFDYHHEYGLSFAKSKGIWTVEDDKIVLNTFEDYLTDFFDISETNDETYPVDRFTVIFFRSGERSHGNLTIGKNDKLIFTNDHKVIEIEKELLIKEKSVSPFISLDPYFDDFKYEIQNFDNNLIIIEIDDVDEDDLRMKIMLKNEILKIRNKKLIDNHGNVYKKLN